MLSPAMFAQQMLQMNPRFQQNPQVKEMLQAVSSGDMTKCEEIGRNMCNTLGIQPQDVISQGKSMFPNMKFPF